MSLPGQDHGLESLGMSKMYGASWKMVESEADEAVPLEPLLPIHDALFLLPGE